MILSKQKLKIILLSSRNCFLALEDTKNKKTTKGKSRIQFCRVIRLQELCDTKKEITATLKYYVTK